MRQTQSAGAATLATLSDEFMHSSQSQSRQDGAKTAYQHDKHLVSAFYSTESRRSEDEP